LPVVGGFPESREFEVGGGGVGVGGRHEEAWSGELGAGSGKLGK
jgi:hypothetical protein